LTLSLRARMSRARPLLVAAALVAGISACEQTLETGIACPALCPQLGDSLSDTTLFPVDFDTSVGVFPITGKEDQVLLMVHAGVYDARAIVRFDSLHATFRYKGEFIDNDIVALDTAMVKFKIARADTLGPALTIEAYDVDDTSATAPDDTAAASLVPRFTAGRLLGSQTFPAATLKDTLVLALDKAKVLEKIVGDTLRRLRLGLRVVGPGPAEIALTTGNGGAPPFLFLTPTADTAQSDTTAEDVIIPALSQTPEDLQTAVELADFQIIAVDPVPPPSDVIRVGGAPGRRAYIRFNIPTQILDSSAVVRATLIMTQRPNPQAPNANDTAGVAHFELLASPLITDRRRALVFLGFGGDTIGLAPKDSGPREFEMITAIRRWRLTSATRTPRVIALVGRQEGLRAWQVDFYGHLASISVQPRLRLTYIPQPKRGLP